MNYLKCPCESCKKEFKKPIVVTNFSDMPKKEIYYACPYCLTKLDFTEECTCTPVDCNEAECVEAEPETTEQTKQHTQLRTVDDSVQHVVVEKLETLEKERTGLLSELDKLRKAATQKICSLEGEVAALKEEAEILRQLTDEQPQVCVAATNFVLGKPDGIPKETAMSLTKDCLGTLTRWRETMKGMKIGHHES